MTTTETSSIGLGSEPVAAVKTGTSPSQTITLIAVLLAVLVVPTSISGTGVALADIGTQTQAGLTSLQWVVNAFNLAFACFTLAWGSIADIVGRARAFTAGAAVYAIASVVSGLATDIYMLDAARALAGIGGASIFACGSAILSTVFTGQARIRAFALFGTVAGIGVAVGPSFSGLIVGHLGWHWIFGVHAMVLALVLAASPVLLRTAVDTKRPGARIDVPGTALFIVAMLLVMMAIVQGSQWGWASAGVVGLLAGGVVLFGVFAVAQNRSAHPMLDLSVLANRRFVGLCLVPVAASFGFVTMLTYLPSYLITVAGKSIGEAGLLMVLLTIPVFICPMMAGKLVARGVSADLLLYASLVCLVVGDLALMVFSASVTVPIMAAPLLITGSGMGLSAGLVDGKVLEIVQEEKAGMAAGVLNTMRLGSEAVAVAIYGSLLATLIHTTLTDRLLTFAPTADAARVANALAAGNLTGAQEAAGRPLRDGLAPFLVGGYDTAFHTILWVLAAICVALSAIIVLLLRKPTRRVAR